MIKDENNPEKVFLAHHDLNKWERKIVVLKKKKKISVFIRIEILNSFQIKIKLFEVIFILYVIKTKILTLNYRLLCVKSTLWLDLILRHLIIVIIISYYHYWWRVVFSFFCFAFFYNCQRC